MNGSDDRQPGRRKTGGRDFSAPPVERPEAIDEFIYDVRRAALQSEQPHPPREDMHAGAQLYTPRPQSEDARLKSAAYQQQAAAEAEAVPGSTLRGGSAARGGAHLAQKPRRTEAKPQTAKAAAGSKGRPAKKKKSKKHRIRTLVMTLLLLVGLYCIAVFSNIPFIKKWRDIYIETAMGTMTHQWLATAFIPDFVIDEVMGTRSDIESDQNSIETNWQVGSLSGAGDKVKWSRLEKNFFKLYPEIDEDSFYEYLDAHGDEVLTDDGYLLIDKAGLDDESTGITTVYGDEVLAIDTVNGITIVKVTGSEYVGRLAIVKDPSQVGLELSENFGSSGSIIANIVENSGGVLAINASGFYDPDGHGNGGTPHGLVIRDGEHLWDWVGQGGDKAIGFDWNDQLNIEIYDGSNDFRDAVEFKPVLVLDGEKVISGSAGWGMQPRSAIGQTDDGQVLLLVVDGRQPGYSIGCTMGDLADIMERYGAEQACNLDGGSSSIMYYNGRKITRPSAGDKQNGRLLPNAFVVSPR